MFIIGKLLPILKPKIKSKLVSLDRLILIIIVPSVIIHLDGPIMVSVFLFRVGSTQAWLQCYRCSIWKKIQKRWNPRNLSRYEQGYSQFRPQWREYGNRIWIPLTQKRNLLPRSISAPLCWMQDQRWSSCSFLFQMIFYSMMFCFHYFLEIN